MNEPILCLECSHEILGHYFHDMAVDDTIKLANDEGFVKLCDNCGYIYVDDCGSRLGWVSDDVLDRLEEYEKK